MSNTDDSRDDIPEEFATEEEAGRFWDTHDSSEYLDDMDPVEADVRLARRHFEIEVDAEVVEALRKRATMEHVAASRLANDLLRKELTKGADLSLRRKTITTERYWTPLKNGVSYCY